MVNNLLLLIFFLTRVFILVNNFIRYLFRDHVSMKRTYNIMGVRFELIDMIKYLYNMFPLHLGVFGTLLMIAMFTMLNSRFEIFNPLIKSVFDSLWYVFITVLTIGYGDIFAVSIIG